MAITFSSTKTERKEQRQEIQRIEASGDCELDKTDQRKHQTSADPPTNATQTSPKKQQRRREDITNGLSCDEWNKNNQQTLGRI